jgi:hypothetical protein
LFISKAREKKGVTMSDNTAPPTELLIKEYLPFLNKQRDIMCNIASRSRFKHYTLQSILIICTAAITITVNFGIP